MGKRILQVGCLFAALCGCVLFTAKPVMAQNYTQTEYSTASDFENSATGDQVGWGFVDDGGSCPSPGEVSSDLKSVSQYFANSDNCPITGNAVVYKTVYTYDDWGNLIGQNVQQVFGVSTFAYPE